jgi:hypothetical protein
MVKQYHIKLTCIAWVIISIFCSCSRQITSTASLKKLENKQALTIDGARITKSPNDDVKKPETPQIAIMTSPTLSGTKEVNKETIKANKSNKIMGRIAAQKFEKAIQKQTAAIRNLYSEKHISSNSKTFDTGGFLGLAVLCLIAGIVLAYFGFHALAALLWVIGIILFAAAILFFILWLIGRAVTD